MAKDPSFPNFNSTDSSGVIGLASPKDRLAAYILDCVLVLPVVQLVQSPVKRAILEATLYDQVETASYFRYFNLLLFITLFIIYYGVMIWWKGQTFGKMFFSVKVISYQGHLNLYQSFLRSLTMFLEMLCLGFPFLTILSHSLRRPIHDRVADTLVISLKSPVGFPSNRERLQSRMIASLMSFSFLLGASLYIYSGERDGALHKNQSFEKNCDKFDNNKQFSLENSVELFLTRKITKDCLYRQAREGLWNGKRPSLSKFAMALAKKDEKEVSERYLKSLCENNERDPLCQFSQWLYRDGDSNVMNEEMGRNLEELPLFAKIYIAIDLEKKGLYKESLELLSKMDKDSEMSEVTASMIFRNLLSLLRWDEAYWVYKTHLGVDDNDFLYFLQREMKNSLMSNQEKLQLIELFYPQIQEEEGGRHPASLKLVPSEIVDIYNLLQSEL